MINLLIKWVWKAILTTLGLINGSYVGELFLDDFNSTFVSDSLVRGSLNQSEYFALASRIGSSLFANGVVNVSCSLGNVGLESALYIFSQVLVSYESMGVFPDFINLKPWSVISSDNTHFVISKAQISWSSFIAIYSVMMFSCATKFKRQITDEEFMKILSSDIPFKLSIGFDNWFNVQDISVLDKKFFKNLLKIKWTKEAKKTHKAIHEGYWLSLSMEYGIKSKVDNRFSVGADYLSCCYAFSEGRNEILPEDQVRAWTLILNLFLADLRPYIFGGDY